MSFLFSGGRGGYGGLPKRPRPAAGAGLGGGDEGGDEDVDDDDDDDDDAPRACPWSDQESATGRRRRRGLRFMRRCRRRM